ncbi:DNA-directed RNA polymerase, mitochondrial [Emydura macquarii macquarii]|uniref:DNA-directed RNA polymerase, mitochondrial n=1 Tax=Emydura macquarii macquarii TaxID=1129001 RepID=UPI00352A7B8D
MWVLLRLRAAGGRAWLRCPGGLWTRMRSYSSANVKEEAGRRGAYGRAELLEVLEARVKQLQADNVSEMVIDRVDIAPAGKNSSQCPAQTTTVPLPAGKELAPKVREGDVSSSGAPSLPSRWVEKLKKDKWIKHKRQSRLEQKFFVASSPPGAERTREPVLEPVLEARDKKLQAHNISGMRVDRVDVAPAWKNSSQCPAQKAAVPLPGGKELAPKVREGAVSSSGAPSLPSRWVEKLKKDTWIKYKRQSKLEQKFFVASSSPGAERTRKPVLEPGKAAVTKESQGRARAIPPKAGANPKVSGKFKTLHKSPRAAMASAQASPRLGSSAKPSAPQGDECNQLEEVPKRKGLDGLMAQQEPRPVLEDKEGNMYRSIQQDIMCYLESCLFINQPERAQQCLMLYHRSDVKRKLLTINMYDMVMHGWAKKGSLNEIGQLFFMLEKTNLKPNLGCYAAALECMGRAHTPAAVIQRCVQEMKEDGFHLDELFTGSIYEKDEREMVLKALRIIKPNFQPPFLPHTEICTSPLLRDFYSKEKPVSYPKLDFSVHELRERFQQQLEMEAADTITINSVESVKPVTEKAIKARELLTALRSEWCKPLLQALRESKIRLENRKSCPTNLYPYLCLLEDEDYVDIMLQSLSRLPAQGDSLLIVAKDLGIRIYNKYSIRKKIYSCLVEKIQKVYEDYAQLLAKDTQPDNDLPREYWEKLEASSGTSLLSRNVAWSNTLLVQLGTHMVELLVQVIKVQSNVLNPSLEPKLIPVLYHVYSFRNSRQVGFIKPHPILTQILLNAAETTLTFNAFVMPMLCPPVPWTSPHLGAYILISTKLMRCLEGAVQHQLLLEKCPRNNLHSVLDALNQLGNCAWKINKPVLDIIISIFNAKGSEKLDIPLPPSEAPKPSTVLPAGPSAPWSKSAMKRELMQWRKNKAEMYSMRMDALYKLSIANHMRDKVFWFPHNMDFRGRTYPCPPHFNHLGSDVTRAILLFAEGKPLGAHGLDWLKIHLINLTGLKKRNSLQERLAYANEIIEEILDSADNPLTGRKWWMDADEPWQTLACCMELAQALRSPDPTAYISHIPIHQDGSCNGLQHYAALGRDTVGATSVNLMPCDVPQDVYNDVAQQVEKLRKQDAEQGSKVAQVLDGFITRKLVKQTVMTVVYGVTRFGGRLQIENRLKEIDGFPKEYVWEASHYLVRQVFNSLTGMFSGTREIQSWLTESAKFIAKSGNTVEWVTPLGLPIVQPYHRVKHTMLKTNFQSLSLHVSYDTNQKPDTLKQKNAFPPNFIHSLDSTHMMLTALHCYRRGLTFVSVHDCYWTHALTVEVMNQVCREQFVELHSQPILQDLSRFMLQKYCTDAPAEGRKGTSHKHKELVEVLSRVPETGDFDLQKVKESTYFFS